MINVQDIDIRFIDREDWEDAMSLSYRVFIEFDAPLFSEEGIRHFKEFVSDNNLLRMFDEGKFETVGAYYRGRLIGVAALRNENHISLLFVDGKYHRCGVGRMLVNGLSDYAKVKLKAECLTVNASPYATEFYHRMGFVDLDGPISKDGITFIPMKYDLQRL